MILGHSELPPLSLVAIPCSVSYPSIEVLRSFVGAKCWLDSAICRALAERGNALLDRDMAIDGVARYGLHWRDAVSCAHDWHTDSMHGSLLRRCERCGALQREGNGIWTDVP
jgi:hypothetical protein